MSTLKTNRIENNAGTHSLSVDDIGYPLSTAWGGTLLTALTTPTLASVGIVGLNPIAYVYPDGTIVGESDNGSFTIHPNGNRECEGNYVGNDFGGTKVLQPSVIYPLVFSINPTFTLTCSAGWEGYVIIGNEAYTTGGIQSIYASNTAGLSSQNVVIFYTAKGR